jgi:OPA family glycerol-3-phosphate transporter-like MFS transporter/OPA family sugar phosphate sensor protein UhpC-like MFS transporter
MAEANGTSPESSRARYLAVLKNWKFYITSLSLGFQNAARYALIVWVPVHLLGSHWKSGGAGIDPIWITLALPVGMALGALSNSWVSDVFFQSKRYIAIITYMCIAAGVAIAMIYVPRGSVTGLVLMFLCGFFVFGPASSFWALCPDLFGRKLSGTATGVLNFVSYTFAGLGEPLIGKIMDVTGETSIIFPLVAGLCVVSAIFAYMIKR